MTWPGIEGEELSLSGDGKTVAFGAPWNNKFGQNRGCVKVYKFDSETSLWEPMGDTLHGEVNGDYFGWFVDLLQMERFWRQDLQDIKRMIGWVL